MPACFLISSIASSRLTAFLYGRSWVKLYPYLVGVAKHSTVLSRDRLAMALEDVLQTDYPAYVGVPREVEERAYVWSEFARGEDRDMEKPEINAPVFLNYFPPPSAGAQDD